MVLIALTGWGQEQDKRRTEDAGFDAHVVKPVDPSALLMLLGQLAQPPG
jgi:CheY-like chemotaxis protein